MQEIYFLLMNVTETDQNEQKITTFHIIHQKKLQESSRKESYKKTGCPEITLMSLFYFTKFYNKEKYNSYK